MNFHHKWKFLIMCEWDYITLQNLKFQHNLKLCYFLGPEIHLWTLIQSNLFLITGKTFKLEDHKSGSECWRRFCRWHIASRAVQMHCKSFGDRWGDFCCCADEKMVIRAFQTPGPNIWSKHRILIVFAPSVSYWYINIFSPLKLPETVRTFLHSSWG